MIELVVAILDQHADWHGWYSGKTTPSGSSCCNQKDCRPAEKYQLVRGGVMFKIETGWVFVPDQKIKYDSPDGRPHYCGFTDSKGGDIPRCGFIPPGQV